MTKTLVPRVPNWKFLSEFNTRRVLDPLSSSWQSLETFNTRSIDSRESATWTSVAKWVVTLNRALGETWSELKLELEIWNRLLGALGGDPSARDWSDFRPLHMRREEDWSDWLQHMLRHAATDVFASTLFGHSAPGASKSRLSEVHREQSTEDGERRADLVIFWNPEEASTVEVKILDQEFAKTFDTCSRLIRDHAAVKTWTHFILLPGSELEKWQKCCSQSVAQRNLSIHALTWEQVALGLRVALLSEAESLPWQIWALTFCGVIEQRLLRYPCANLEPSNPDFRDTTNRMRAVELLELLKRARTWKERR